MSDPFEGAVTARAASDLDRLPEKIATASVEFIFGPLAANPRRVGKPLWAELAGSQVARRGDYRVVCAIRDATHIIEIEHIGRRSDVYGDHRVGLRGGGRYSLFSPARLHGAIMAP